MEKFGIAGLLVGLFFVLPLIGVTVGAFSGWVAGLVFTDTLTQLAVSIGFERPWEIGAVLGFVSGFFARNESKNG